MITGAFFSFNRKNNTLNESPICINEICTNNYGGYNDTSLQYNGVIFDNYCGYIELYNKSGETVNLDDYSISIGNEEKLVRLSGLSIPAHDFIVLLADEQEQYGTQHLPFKLKKGKSSVAFLLDKNGKVIEYVPVPEMTYDVATLPTPVFYGKWVLRRRKYA